MDNASADPIFTKSKLIKNLLVLSISYLLSFCASDGWAVLQSTMNQDEGVGVTAIAVQYIFACISALFFPKYLIKKYGSKVIIGISMFSYVPYLAANFYPKFALMIPTSIILGFGSSLLWGSLAVYLTDMASIYTNLCVCNANLTTTKHLTNTETSDEKIGNTNKKAQKFAMSNTEVNSDLRNVCTEKSRCEENKLKLNSNESVDEVADSSWNEDNIERCQYCNLIKYGPSLERKNINLVSNDLIVRQAVNETVLSDQNNKISLQKMELLQKPELLCHCDSNSLIITNCSNLRNNLSEDNVTTNVELGLLESNTSRIFGFFGFIFQTCHIWSNVISYSILQSNSEDTNFFRNSSCMCGANFCGFESNCVEESLQLPNSQIRYILSTVYLLMGFLPVCLVFFCLDELRKDKIDVVFSLDLALSVFKFHKKKIQLLITPLTLYIGMADAFVIGDYTKDFVGCAWGVKHVTLVLICCGCSLSISCWLSGWIGKYIGRRTIFLAIAVLNLAVNIIMLTWTPNSKKPIMMFFVVGMWGSVIGSLWCQLRAFIGVCFSEDEEVAFGSYEFWHGLSCAICFSYSIYICTYLKIYLLLIGSTIGFVCYFLAEKSHSKI